MLENRKNITSLHDVRPPESFEPKKPTTPVVSAVEPKDFVQQIKEIDIKVSGKPIEEITLKPKDPIFILSNIRKQNSVSDEKLINKRKVRNKFRTLIFTSIILFIILYGLSLYNLKNNTLGNISSVQTELKKAIDEFRNFNNVEAGASLKNVADNFQSIGDQLNQRGLLKISAVLGSVFPVAKNAKQSFDTFKLTLDGAINLNENLSNLKNNGLSYFMNGKGDKISEILKAIKTNLSQVISSGETLQKLGASLSDSYLFQGLNLSSIDKNTIDTKEGYNVQEFLNSLISILTSKEQAHLLLLFQNSSEIRPAGGFIGSYADLTIKDGALNAFDVRDIYDPDGWVVKKVIPPKPLQAITPVWEARDANWFFDFKTSAEKVIGMLEDSLFYKEQNVSFIGAIGINTSVMEDLISITGPIELPQYNLTITKENFLEKVQFEVEAGTNKAKNQPKKILSDLTSKLLEKISLLTSEEKEKLFDILREDLKSKSIQIYFKDKSLEQFMKEYNISGSVFVEPENWHGDYLAVVNANVASGKTDVFIDQKISFKSSIDISGKVSNEVTVERSHRGGSSKYYWYNVTNKDYMRLLTPKDVTLLGIKGDTAKLMKSPMNYKALGYSSDPEIDLLEVSKIESNWNVLSAWSYTAPKSSSTIIFTYERPNVLKLEKGSSYQFVYDKQSGVQSGISVSIEAPPGYRWKESKSSIFTFEDEMPEARISLNLTLEDI